MIENEFEDILDKRFGVFIRTRREHLNKSLDTVALYANMSVRRLTELENGMPNIGVTKKEIAGLSKTLAVTIEELVEVATAKDELRRKKKDHIYAEYILN